MPQMFPMPFGLLTLLLWMLYILVVTRIFWYLLEQPLTFSLPKKEVKTFKQDW